MRPIPTILALSALATLAACNSRADEASNVAPEDSTPVIGEPLPNVDEPVSILRPDVEQPELPEIVLEPLNVTIGFPDGGTVLDASATAALEELLASDQVADGGPIILRAHSDAGGNDAANMRASTARGEKVRDWLTSKGIDANRITVIAFGEQNPVQPNALPDGNPSETGRAANRRVDIEVAVIGTAVPEVETVPET